MEDARSINSLEGGDMAFAALTKCDDQDQDRKYHIDQKQESA